MNQDPIHRLARFFAGGGGTPEERELFSTLCKSLPELDATYKAILAAWEDEAADALEEASPDTLHAFLTGTLPANDAGDLCARILASDDVATSGLLRVLGVYPHLWANAHRVLPESASYQDQLRLGYCQVALSALDYDAENTIADLLSSGKGIAAHNALHHLAHERGESIIPEKLADAYKTFRRIHFRSTEPML